MIFLAALFYLFLGAGSARAAESEVRLPVVVFSEEEGSFESLRSETLVPGQDLKLDTSRATLLDSFKWNTLYPVTSYGYPSGNLGVTMGGRNADDNQLTTLGIPLNLPQGGGPDYSFFPSYLWSKAIYGPSPTGASVSLQSTSGGIELVPWTRAMIGDTELKREPDSRITATGDQDLQSFSIGTRKGNASILGGMSFGKTRGPGGSLSYRVLEGPGLSLTAHVLGADQEGNAPDIGSPDQMKHTTRLIPALEANYKVDRNLQIKTTWFADLQRYVFESPDYQSRTEQYGVQSAVLHGNWLFSISARSVHFHSESTGDLSELPAFASAGTLIPLSSTTRVRLSANTEYLNTLGFYPGGRASFEVDLEKKRKLYAEANTLPRMPSLIDRYYYGYNYQGNAELRPERSFAALLGYKDQVNPKFKTHTLLKAELRNDSILKIGSSMANAGNSTLLSASEEATVGLLPWLQIKANLLGTYSNVDFDGLPYPYLPSFSAGGGIAITPSDSLTLESQVKFMGESNTGETTSPAGKPHPSYFLAGERVNYAYSRDLDLTFGVDDLFDRKPEAVSGYPLPGRRLYASLSLRF